VRIDHGDVVNVCVPEDFEPKLKTHYSHSFYPQAQPYSMPAERPGEFDITFKVYPGGRCSGYLDSVPVGDTVEVFKGGALQRRPGKYVGIIAYGVGITTAFPVAEAELEKPDAEHVKLLWASKTIRDMFWHEQLSAACRRYPGRFSIATILSRERREDSLHGRINDKTLSDVFDASWRTAHGQENEADRDQVRFLVIGTQNMIRDTNTMLKNLGYPWLRHSLLRAF
jgi:ring-1,2-phenylacetyl-CoA epoxidase subunit PaaE